MALRLRGALDRGALERALDAIVARHEALRTTFAAVDGEPVQRIAPAGERVPRWWSTILTGAPDAEDASCGAWCGRRRARPSTWQRGR